MTIDFTISPDYGAGGRWDLAEIRINTNRGVKAYNEYFCTERTVGEKFMISKSLYADFQRMQEISGLTTTFK